MCGIAGAIGEDARDIALGLLDGIGHRGPDASGLFEGERVALSHARLSIVDPDSRSDQPFRYGSTVVSFNGEIWNYRELRAELEAMGYDFRTESDTETLAAALDVYGERVVPRLNGMFAFAWFDDGQPDLLRLARDRYGEVPLHFARVEKGWVFASELKAFSRRTATRALWVEPATIVSLRVGEWPATSVYYATQMPVLSECVETDPERASQKVGELLAGSCIERLMSDVPVCALLSGGIDSSAILANIAPHVDDLVAYTAVLDPRSRDLRMAREVAHSLGVELREIDVPPPTPEDLSEVVRVIELPHKAQVEIGWACLHLARAIHSDGFKVTYSGEGSDELWGSYAFSYHALESGTDFRSYRHDLFKTQHRKNFARCNKVFMDSGIECRLPFLNPSLVDYALGLPEWCVREGKGRPKAILERALADVNALPAEVLKRPKVAFQDGMGLKDAAAEAVSSPKRFYGAEYKKLYGRAA